VFNWRGNIYSIFGGQLYKDGVAKGAVDTTSPYTFSSILGSTPQLFLKNLSAAYYYDDGGGLVQVTDPDYPATTVRGCVYLNGTMYVMDEEAAIRGSEFNDLTTWPVDNKILAQIEPDLGACITKNLVYAIALKTISTEVFYDAGNPAGSPLGPVSGSKLGVGVRSPGSVTRCGDDLAWIGTTTEGNMQAMLMQKVSGGAISTPPIERLIAGLDYTTVWGWAIRVGGHRYYVVTWKESNFTLAFDLTMGTWYIWTDPNGNYLPIVSSTFDAQARPVLQHESNGKLYTMRPETHQDDGANFLLTLYTENFDGGVKGQKTCSRGQIVADQGATSIGVSWSDDDYQTFSTPQTVSLDQELAMFQDGSSFRRRAYKLTHLDNMALRIKRMDLMVSAGDV